LVYEKKEERKKKKGGGKFLGEVYAYGDRVIEIK